MTGDMTATHSDSEACAKLLAEHERLRFLLLACEEEAGEILGGRETTGRRLLETLLELLDAFENHNREEESQLHPLLLAADSFGEVRVAEMVADHLQEHAALREALREVVGPGVPDRSARAALEVVCRLRHHLEAEEAQFLNQRVLRDDLVSLDAFGG